MVESITDNYFYFLKLSNNYLFYYLFRSNLNIFLVYYVFYSSYCYDSIIDFYFISSKNEFL